MVRIYITLSFPAFRMKEFACTLRRDISVACLKKLFASKPKSFPPFSLVPPVFSFNSDNELEYLKEHNFYADLLPFNGCCMASNVSLTLIGFFYPMDHPNFSEDANQIKDDGRSSDLLICITVYGKTHTHVGYC